MAQIAVFKTLTLDDTFQSLVEESTVLSGTLEAPLGNANAIEVRPQKTADAQEWPPGTAAYLEQVDISEIGARDPQNGGAKLVFIGQSCPS